MEMEQGFSSSNISIQKQAHPIASIHRPGCHVCQGHSSLVLARLDLRRTGGHRPLHKKWAINSYGMAHGSRAAAMFVFAFRGVTSAFDAARR